MFKWHLIKPLPGIISGSVFFAYFLLLKIVVADVEAPALQYIARRLLPNECQSIVNHEASEPFNIPPVPISRKTQSNGIDCFRKLVGWASDLRLNRRNAHLLLGNRLRQIGRDDLATWLFRPSSEDQETIEYDSWNSKKEKSPNLHQQSSISKFPDVRKLNGIHSLDTFKDRYSVMVEPESVQPVTSAPQYVTAEPTGHQEEHGDLPGVSSSTQKEVQNDTRDSNTSQTAVTGKTPEDKKIDKLKLPRILPHLTDEKTAPCLRVPLGTALVVIGTIMILTCCCALLLRNRLAACFERFRGKKTRTSKRISTDEEQGFMGPRTVGKPPKRSGRKGGGPIDVANVGVQNNNTASNASLESDEKPTGCCNCCAKKKKRNKKRWKK